MRKGRITCLKQGAVHCGYTIHTLNYTGLVAGKMFLLKV